MDEWGRGECEWVQRHRWTGRETKRQEAAGKDKLTGSRKVSRK